jgi:hypothetical protein
MPRRCYEVPALIPGNQDVHDRLTDLSQAPQLPRRTTEGDRFGMHETRRNDLRRTDRL